MTPFDMLFFGLLALLTLVALADLIVIVRVERKRARPPQDQAVRDWIQVWPPDDRP